MEKQKILSQQLGKTQKRCSWGWKVSSLNYSRESLGPRGVSQFVISAELGIHPNSAVEKKEIKVQKGKGKGKSNEVLLFSLKCVSCGWGRRATHHILHGQMWAFNFVETSLGGLEDHLAHSRLQFMLQFYVHACTAGRL